MQEGTSILHYEILEKIGEGGMGVVYKARDTKLDRTVALKFLPPHLTRSEKDRQRFIREAKSAAALNHPNICTIHSVEEHKGKDFISMEYIDGQTLREKLESGEMTFESALEYAVQIAEALGRAHDKGIIHRDIKPGNIMIDVNNHVKVMDFGLAKMADSAPITKTDATVGTMAYMAPEQIEGKQIDHRADLFSFGVVLYEMLTGERPFQGKYEAALSYAIVNEEPTPIENYFQSAPQKLVEFFKRVLAKQPEDRIENAAMARNLLENIKSSKSGDLERTQQTVTKTASTNPQSDSGSTTISITLPSFGFGNMSIGRVGLFAGVIGILALFVLAGWWFMGEDTIEDNTLSETSVSATEITDRSIAVLPFNNLSGTDEITSITRGIHDDLLTRLSNIGDLRVTSRTSVGHYRNTDLSLPVIADSLGVRWIMVGGVQQGGDQIQVNAQLIDPRTDANVWADSYRRELTAENLFSIQEEITGEIAEALQAELTAGEQERISGVPTKDLGAYHFYVQGRNLLDQRTSGEDVQKAGALFLQALEQDTTLALAWSGLADAMAMGLEDSIDSRILDLQNITHEQAARRALELSPDLSEAHNSMGIVHATRKNGPMALCYHQRAIELKPSFSEAHNTLGRTYMVLGFPDQAIEHFKLAEELNPQHYHVRHALYDAYNIKGKFEQALEEANKQQRMAPEWTSSYFAEVRALYQLGKYETARKAAQEGMSEGPDRYNHMWQSYLAVTEAALGDTASAKKRLSKLQAEETHPLTLVYAHAALGDVESTIEAYQRIEEWGWASTLTLRYLEFPETLREARNDPRHRDLIRKVNQYWGLNPDGSLPKKKVQCEEENA